MRWNASDAFPYFRMTETSFGLPARQTHSGGKPVGGSALG
jgi:hypothetical protein